MLYCKRLEKNTCIYLEEARLSGLQAAIQFV
jgi:hypothetical protein